MTAPASVQQLDDMYVRVSSETETKMQEANATLLQQVANLRQEVQGMEQRLRHESGVEMHRHISAGIEAALQMQSEAGRKRQAVHERDSEQGH